MLTVPRKPIVKMTREEVAKHHTKEDAWIILHGMVYDITEFLAYHPGGVECLLEYLGKDGTAAFGTLLFFYNILCSRRA